MAQGSFTLQLPVPAEPKSQAGTRGQQQIFQTAWDIAFKVQHAGLSCEAAHAVSGLHHLGTPCRW